MKSPALSVPTLRYAALNAAFWSGFCLLMAFASVFLLARGLSNTQIGITIAVAGALSAALQPVVAGWADRSRLPLRFWIGALALAMALVATALRALPAGQPLRDAVLFGFLMGTLQVILPLVNAIGMAAAADGVPVDFGTARAVGSLAFAVTSTVAGAFIAAAGPDVIPALVVVMQGVMIVAALTFVFARSSDAAAAPATDDDDSAEPAPLSPAARRRFGVLILGMIGLYVGHSAINGFLFQVLRPLGGDAATMGLAYTVGAGLEVIPMLFFRQIVARFSPAALLRVAAMAFLVKSVLTWLAPNLAVFFMAQLLQMVSFALIVPASVYYVERLLPTAERVRGQSFMTLALTLGNVVSGLVGGYLLDAAGVPTMLLFAVVVTAVGVLAALWGTRTRVG